jgi:GTP-binding protein
VDAYHIVRGELDAYGAGLIEKPEVIALNKVDALDDKGVAKLAKKLAKASGAEVMPLSGATGAGLEAVLDRLVAAIPAPEKQEEEEAWSPL